MAVAVLEKVVGMSVLFTHIVLIVLYENTIYNIYL